jgi:hypothetical protein
MKRQRNLFGLLALALAFVSADCMAGLLDGLGLDSAVSQEETNYTCTPVPAA